MVEIEKKINDKITSALRNLNKRETHLFRARAWPGKKSSDVLFFRARKQGFVTYNHDIVRALLGVGINLCEIIKSETNTEEHVSSLLSAGEVPAEAVKIVHSIGDVGFSVEVLDESYRKKIIALGVNVVD